MIKIRKAVRRSGLAFAAVVLLWTAIRPATAHVRYVTEDYPDDGLEFTIEVLTDPVNALLFGTTGLLAVAGVGAYLWVRPTIPDFEVLQSALQEYLTYVPWMLRLSLGLPLVGAGFIGYLFSPSVRTADLLGPALQAEARVLLIGIGFFLLFGLATRAVALIGLATYAGSVIAFPTAVLALEYVPGFIAIALLGGGRPSADHLLERVASSPGTYYSRIDPVHRWAGQFRRRFDPYTAYVPTVLRIGLGATFVLLGLGEKLLRPGPGLAVVDKYNLTAVVPVDPGVWVVGAGLAEIAFGIALLLGLLTRATAAGAFVLFTITLFALPDDPVLAHITMFGLASAVFTLGGGPLSVDSWLESSVEPERKTTPSGKAERRSG
ncbi:DoxX family protein [Halapricum hydrolyticum]|uniref:DoxX family protein n=1 Tax=Halapricum hydrolyticum TaxID=2979991 RepID=A0AAE3IAQ6_9EURY|nr:DoxX family protein [Halapricum hydrolyticum]MCU4717940.1 DoxX family protein [Halapricum hydrolyticum]MCU4727105.1 DoxX family protein [Halapricum hydrolyticum]